MSVGTSIVSLLKARPEDHLGKTLEVSGWVRTRRDSKAGISFIQLSDGSCFDAFQIVVPSDLDNYESESTGKRSLQRFSNFTRLCSCI